MNFMTAANGTSFDTNGIIGEARSLAASVRAGSPFAVIVRQIGADTVEAVEAWANGAGLTVEHMRGLTAYFDEVEFMPKDSDACSVWALVFEPAAA